MKRVLNAAYDYRVQSYYSICSMFIVTEETLLHSSQTSQKNRVDCNYLLEGASKDEITIL